jgi:DNA-binding NtrC family response regulator
MVSTDIPLLTSIHHMLAADHHTVTVFSDYQRLLNMLSQSPLHGIICIDLDAPPLAHLLQLVPNFAQSVAFILIGDIQKLSSSEQAIIQSLLIPTFDLPAQALAFRQTIQQLARQFP